MLLNEIFWVALVKEIHHVNIIALTRGSYQYQNWK